MKNFGYFVTESSGHASEYVPYFRKNTQMVDGELSPRFKNPADFWFDFAHTGGYLRHCQKQLILAEQEFGELIEGVKDLPTSERMSMARSSSKQLRRTDRLVSMAMCQRWAHHEPAVLLL